jgi:hypothetical protein
MNNLGNPAAQMEPITPKTFTVCDLPARKGRRPETLSGPLHIQCNGYGDPKYLNRLIDSVCDWPHIESAPPSVSGPDTIRIRLKETAVTDDSSAFIGIREFARVLLGTPTIYLALPLVCAHWAIVRGWAEPHYLRSFGLMPAGALVVYTPKDQEELSVCSSLFSAAYHFACRLSTQNGMVG